MYAEFKKCMHKLNYDNEKGILNMREEKNNKQGITPKQFSLWQDELIEQARHGRKRAERLLFVSMAFNVILAAVILFR